MNEEGREEREREREREREKRESEREERDGGTVSEREEGSRKERSMNQLEFSDPLEHTPVLVIAEMVIVPSCVPGVEGVIANDVEPFFWQLALLVTDQDLIEVLVMTKGHQHFVQATVGLVHAMLCTVRIQGKCNVM